MLLNMATITASLERSLQNCSLNQTSSRGRSSSLSTTPPSNSLDHHNHTRNRGYHLHNQDLATNSNASSSDDNSTFVELNSHVSLPYHWEQCLDLKTGELYYINWSNGMKSKDDPRTTAVGYSGDYYSEEEEEEEEDDDNEDSNGYDSEGSSTETSSSSSTNFRTLKKPLGSGSYARHQRQEEVISQDSVLVVAGCKSCLMYHMVPKHVEDCPKCSGQLLHFAANNPSNSNSSP